MFVAHYKMVRQERSGPFPSLAIYAIMKFVARPARDVEDAVPYCGAGHIIDSRFSRQYRIILSADTASEVRQLLSQKRR